MGGGMGDTEKGDGFGDEVEEYRIRGVGWADLGKEVMFQTTVESKDGN